MSTIPRILVRRRAALGDVLCATPAVRRLRLENPSALIHFATLHPAAVRLNPHIDAIAQSDHAQYDRIIDFDGVPERARASHAVDAYMRAAFGNAEGDKTIVFTFDPAPPLICADLPWRDVITVHIAQTWPNRTLPAALWRDTIAHLVAAGKIIAITGGAQDGCAAGAIDLRGRLSLAEQASLLSHSAAALLTNSGLASLAGATDVPIISFYTITRFECCAPYRHGELGWNVFPLVTPMVCYACGEAEPPSEYFECRRGDNACVASFDATEVAERVLYAIEHDRRKELTP